MPHASMPSTDARSVASFPASVVIGSAVHTATRTVQTSSMPSQRGCAATAWKVSFGAVMIPTNLAGRLRGAGDAPGTAAVFVIWKSWELLILLQYVSSSAEVS